MIDAVAAAAAGSPFRGVHALAEQASDAIDDARAEVATWLGGTPGEVVFTSGTTASINLVAQAWGRANVGRGDAIVVTELEHHSNLVPWQMLCAERGAELRVAPIDDAGHLDVERIPLAGAKLLAVAHVSNVTGTIAPIAELARRAHAAGALILVDGAQAVAARTCSVDVRALGCDFYALSAPQDVRTQGRRRAVGTRRGPRRDAAVAGRRRDGRPRTAGAVRSRHAERRRHRRARRRGALPARCRSRARDACPRAARRRDRRVGRARILGAPELALVSFVMPRAHAHDVATICDRAGVALRSGHHCAEPLHRRLGVDASARASVACYSGDDDIDALATALRRVREVFP